MDPIALFAQHFGKKVPALLAPNFIVEFFIAFAETKDVIESLKRAARNTSIIIIP